MSIVDCRAPSRGRGTPLPAAHALGAALRGGTGRAATTRSGPTRTTGPAPPRWLPDRHVGAAGHAGAGDRQAGTVTAGPPRQIEVGHPQLAAVPRHVRVVPAQPGQAAAVGARAGCGRRSRRPEARTAGHDPPDAGADGHDLVVDDGRRGAVRGRRPPAPSATGRRDVRVAVGPPAAGAGGVSRTCGRPRLEPATARRRRASCRRGRPRSAHMRRAAVLVDASSGRSPLRASDDLARLAAPARRIDHLPPALVRGRLSDHQHAAPTTWSPDMDTRAPPRAAATAARAS